MVTLAPAAALVAYAYDSSARGDDLVGIAVGVVGLAVAALAWSGRWRSWTSMPGGRLIITVLPPGAAVFLVFGLGAVLPDNVDTVLGAVALLAELLGWVLLLWQPRWFGPRWLRGYRPDARTSAVVARNQAIYGTVPPERNSEQLARAARAPAQPLARRQVLLIDPTLGRPTAAQTEGAAAGHLLLYPDELVFVAERGDDATRPGPTIRALPAGQIVGIREAAGTTMRGIQLRFPRVEVITTDGPGWEFEATRAAATVNDLRRTYLPAEQAPT